MGKYLVTGGAGFIGSNLCEVLVMRGDRVRVLDDLSTGRLENLHTFMDRIEFIHGCIENPNDVRRAADGIDTVVHLAAIPSVVHSVEDPVSTDRVNIHGTLQLLLAARDARVRRVVFASSCAVYGEDETLPKTESMLPAPASPYALSKLAGEHYCALFSHLYGLSTISLRLFNIFGPRQDPSSPYSGVISIFIERMLQRQRPTICGDGEQSRDFTYVANVIAAILSADQYESASGQVVNIGTGKRNSVKELYAVIQKLTGFDQTPLFADARPGDVRHSEAQIALAQELLGYRPSVDFHDGLKMTLAFFTSRRGA